MTTRSALWFLMRIGAPLFVSLRIGVFAARGEAQSALPAGGQSVLPVQALLTTPVGGLERTQSHAEIVSVQGQPFAKALRVVVRANAPETNATQLTMNITEPIRRGDVLLASFAARGAAADGRNPAQVMFLFERNVEPWTKSVLQTVTTQKDARAWKRVLVPFRAAEDYRPGEAMVSLRFAFGPQTVEVGGLSVVSFGRRKTLDELIGVAAEQNPLGAAQVIVRRAEKKQTLLGFGGDFCQPRYGATEPMDAVGRYNLQHLRVIHARIGIPLNDWTPTRGDYRDDGPAHAALLQMQEMARRKTPMVGSVWEGPLRMLGGQREQTGRTLPPERYADCIEAIARFLVTARDKYGATVENISFNEPDYGVNFRFTSAQMADFIRQAGPRFRELGLKTKFLVGDTANATSFADYARPLLEDSRLAPYLGPLAFHCWDSLLASDAQYAEIAALGRKFGKPVWCTEAGHDAQLWQTPDPWASWENGLRTALAYAKTLNLTGATLMDYWTYQDNYPLVSRDGTHPYPVFTVIQQMEQALPSGATIVTSETENKDLRALAAIGPKPGQVAVLLVNPVGAGRVTLSGLPPNAPLSVVQSDATSQRKPMAMGQTDRQGRFTVAIPSRSVLTVDIGGTTQ